MPRAKNVNLPRKWVIMDPKGRITIPQYMREKLEMDDSCPLLVELYPPDKPDKLVITKSD